MTAIPRRPRRKADLWRVPMLVLAVVFCLAGCEGDGSDGASPRIVRSSTPDCLPFAGSFPPGFATLPGADTQAAVVQFSPPAVLGLNLGTEPPSLLASGAIPTFPLVPCSECGGNPAADSDGDGVADRCASDALGFLCQSAIAGSLSAVTPRFSWLSSSGYEQLIAVDPQTGERRDLILETPPAGPTFDPADWPFWPVPGAGVSRTGLSTRVCVYTDGPDSLGDPIGANRFCDAGRDGFVTGFTAGSVATANHLFVATSNLLRSSEARFAPGTVLVFEFDRTVSPPVLRPDPDRSVILASGFNTTAVAAVTTPLGRELVLVGVSGAVALGVGSDLVRSESAVDVIDATTRELIATIPLGRAGLGDGGIAIDPSGRLALFGSLTDRVLFGIDLAALDDPALGSTGPGAPALPVVLDGSTAGFPDARVYTADAPLRLPKRVDGPSPSQCSTLTSVAIARDTARGVATDFCDGTVSVLDIQLPADRTTPLIPAAAVSVARFENVAAPILAGSTGQMRAIDRIAIRPGRPGIDYTGPDVYFTVGLEEGAVCGVRIDAL